MELDTYERPCPGCGGTAYEPGLVEDSSGSGATIRWYPGIYRRQYFGWRWQKARGDKLMVESVRCLGCGRLELFARHIG